MFLPLEFNLAVMVLAETGAHSKSALAVSGVMSSPTPYVYDSSWPEYIMVSPLARFFCPFPFRLV